MHCRFKKFMCCMLSLVLGGTVAQSSERDSTDFVATYVYGRMERQLDICEITSAYEHFERSWRAYGLMTAGAGASFAFGVSAVSFKVWHFLVSAGLLLLGGSGALADVLDHKSHQNFGPLAPKRIWHALPTHAAWSACGGLFTAELNTQERSIVFWEKGQRTGVRCLLSPDAEDGFVNKQPVLRQEISSVRTLRRAILPLNIQYETCATITD